MMRQIQRFDADHDYQMKAKPDGYWVRWEDVNEKAIVLRWYDKFLKERNSNKIMLPITFHAWALEQKEQL